MITLQEIARKAGVSKMSVSKALRDATDISVKQKKRIKAIADNLGYMPNQVACNFRFKSTRSIGVIVPDITQSFFPQIVLGLESILNRAGYQLVLTHSGDDPLKEETLVKKLLSHRMDGLIIAHTRSHKPLLQMYRHLKNQNYPIVFIDRFLEEDLSFPSIISDDTAGSRLMTEHLINLGHKSIAYVAGHSNISTSEIRKQAVLETLKLKKLKPYAVIEAGFDIEDGRRAAVEILSQNSGELPTAIIAVTDPVAISIIQHLIDSGISVPEQISVAGYSGIPSGAYCKIPLTTIVQPATQLGEVAAQTMLDRLAGKKVRSQTLPVTLEIRKSTASPQKRIIRKTENRR